MSEIVYPLFEFYHTNVGGIYKLDVPKGLVERVYVEAVSADGANEYMESLGADFNDYCSCCGNRWYRASKPTPRGEDGDTSIDVRWSKERVAVHKIDGSFVIWSPKQSEAPKPLPSLEEMREEAYKVGAPKPISKAEYKAEEERINEALKPRYNAEELEADLIELLSAIQEPKTVISFERLVCDNGLIYDKPNMFLLSHSIKL